MMRIRWFVAPAGRWLGWKVVRKNMLIGYFLTKKGALRFARRECKHEWDKCSLLSELVVMDRAGLWTREGSTFGADPVRSVG